MSNEKIKVFLIGLGRMGMTGFKELKGSQSTQTHFNHIITDNRFELIGVWDTDLRKLERVKKKYSKTLVISNEFEDIETDLFVIATPESTHLDIVRKIVKNCHVKVLMCEKPVGSSQREMIEIDDLLEKTEIECIVNYPRSLSIKNANLFEKIKSEFARHNPLVIANISDSSNSALWHFFNLLMTISEESKKLTFSHLLTVNQKRIRSFVGECPSFSLHLNLIDFEESSLADVIIYTPESTYFFLNGFTEIHASSNERSYGWRKTLLDPEEKIDLMADFMDNLYDAAIKILRNESHNLDQMEVVKQTHSLIERFRGQLNGN